ncbi:MAG TPA: hypothetical protein VHM65_04690, partial [Candidatus Lustribacter sp.]|nr:hypothetical protein [Candidatus Lustribacter sp.]
SEKQAGLNLPIITMIEGLLERGRSSGELHREVEAIELHLMMSALALFRITNAPTIEATFGVRMNTPEYRARQIELLTSMVTTWLTTPDASDTGT